MTINFPDPAPIDIQIERQVDIMIQRGCALPRWGWAVPSSYNGATGHERIAAWQKMIVAERFGLVGPRGTCTVCYACEAEARHHEIYARGILAMSICKSCHFHLHRRFRDPGRWALFLAQSVSADSWATKIKLFELDRHAAIRIAHHPDIFAALAELPD